MEAMTMTEQPKPSTLEALKQFSKNPPVSNTPEGGNLDNVQNDPGRGNLDNGTDPGKSVLPDSDFMNTGKHTQDPLFNPSGNAKTIEMPGIKPGTGQAGNIRPIGQLVPNAGKFATTLLDMLLPACIIFFARQAGYITKKEALKLNKEEKETLAPAFENYLNSININFDKPIYQLLIVLGLVYGSKFMEGDIQFTKGKITPDKKQLDIKVTNENYAQVFDLEREKLITQYIGKWKKSRMTTIKSLTDQGFFKTLDKELRLRHGIKNGVATVATETNV
jgi:hypothetical protein